MSWIATARDDHVLEESEDGLHDQAWVAAQQLQDGLRAQEGCSLLGVGEERRLDQRVEAVVVQAHERTVVDDFGE